ncbi:ESCRT-II complex subunit-domain-containing protein [Terfezia claveryi]|nr:ESCRT-II complex subunit-domain-containing protein [Terfezia claveryi]
MTSTNLDPAVFPPQYSYPPFFTRQPNSTTWASQRLIWATFILQYCRARKLWKAQLSEVLESELFWNRALGRRLKPADAVEILSWMSTEGQIEWETTATTTTTATATDKSAFYIYWRRVDEWANIIYDWIDSTGQKNAVLTLYEISEGDLSVSQEFHGMDPHLVRKSLEILMKRGVAQIFSINDEFGVKFF